jgi:uncharacterized protein YqjF (DUF2071 family)
MLNYEVDPAILRPLVPAGTELDFWQGRALVSVVAFRFLDTRLRGVPIPLHRDFDEIIPRFYVRRYAGGAWRRAVVFIREVVPRVAIATVARLAYNEPYVALPMRHEVQMEGARRVGARALPVEAGPLVHRRGPHCGSSPISISSKFRSSISPL